jgi:pre-mRNA-splicing factor CWC22
MTTFERFRAILNEGKVSPGQRVQYMIEVLMQVRKDKYKDNTILSEGLDLVEEDEQITHQILLDEELDVQDSLSKFEIYFFFFSSLIGLQRSDFFWLTDNFKFDPKYLEKKERYKSIKAEILGEDSDDKSGSGSKDDDSEEEEGK